MAVIYSSNAAIENIAIADDNVELKAYVDAVPGSQMVGLTKQLKVFKFVLNNNNGKRVQCVAWEKEADRMAKIIEMDQIVHIDGAQAKAFQNSRYNLGNVHFELNIRKVTEVEVFGEREIARPDVHIPVVAWDEIAEKQGEKIAITGWVKFNFRESRHFNNQSCYGFGSITNGVWKLEVRLTSLSGLPADLRKGAPLKIIGTVEFSNYLFLRVDSGSDVGTNEEPYDPEQMFNITAPPPKMQRVA